MPTYEYACKQCGEHLDVVQSFTDDALTTCPSCAGSLRKVFGTIGISFKGSGFYKNDSRSSGNGASKQEKAEKAEKKDGSSGTSDSGSSESTTKAADGASTSGSDAAKPKKADAPTAAP